MVEETIVDISDNALSNAIREAFGINNRVKSPEHSNKGCHMVFLPNQNSVDAVLKLLWEHNIESATQEHGGFSGHLGPNVMFILGNDSMLAENPDLQQERRDVIKFLRDNKDRLKQLVAIENGTRTV